MLSKEDDILEQVKAKSILSAGYANSNSWFGCNYNMNFTAAAATAVFTATAAATATMSNAYKCVSP